MEVVGIVLITLFGIYVIFDSGGAYFDENGPGGLISIVLLILGIASLIIASNLIYNAGRATGNVTADNLQTGARYETRCTTRDNDGKYIVVLNHDNDFTCHRLDQQPPSIFKKTDDPKNPYQPYPR